MLKMGLIVGCDRCGWTQFFEDDEKNGKNSNADYLTSEWKFKEDENIHLCPDCASLYDKRMHTFMNEVLEEKGEKNDNKT